MDSAVRRLNHRTTEWWWGGGDRKPTTRTTTVQVSMDGSTSGWRRRLHSWLLCGLRRGSHLPVPRRLPPGTCHGSTLGCCLPSGRQSALCGPGRNRDLSHGCLPRFSPHLDHRAGRKPPNAEWLIIWDQPIISNYVSRYSQESLVQLEMFTTMFSRGRMISCSF